MASSASAGLQRANTTANASRQPAPRAALQRASVQPVPKNSRQRSLRHVKDSTEDLQRRKSTRRKSSPPPADPSLTGRGGQQFRVGNIGNNGMIYLRPVSRSSKNAPGQLPITPPQSAGGEDEDGAEPPPPLPTHPPWRESLFSTGTQLSTPPRQSAPAPERHRAPRTPPSSAQTRPRSSAPTNKSSNKTSRTSESQSGPLKIVIDRASPRKSPEKPTEDLLNDLPLLGIEIPHYRLGAPRFTGRGSAFFQSIHSSNVSEHSSDLSRLDIENMFPSPPGRSRLSAGFRVLSQGSIPTRGSQTVQKRSASTDMLTLLSTQRRSNRSPAHYRYSQPGDEAFVRLSPITGQVVSATPSQLITQITSPSLLDYELMSDFFLTYRSFLPPEQLAEQLVARLIWACGRGDDFGRIIRVRTFVALRHWVLNYFVDDFFPNLELRREFCRLINEAVYELNEKARNAAGDLKIMQDLKRSWRKQCLAYWDIPDVDGDLPLEPLVPGGRPETRLSDVEDGHSEAEPAEALARPPQARSYGRQSPNPFLDMLHRAHNPQHLQHQSQASSATEPSKAALLPRDSDQSAYYISCSIPSTTIHKAASMVRPKNAPRPVQITKASRQVIQSPPSAYRPFKAGHQRGGSFADSGRDQRGRASESKKSTSTDAALETLPGSLVRGALYHPPSSRVEFIAPSSPTEERAPFEAVKLEPYDAFNYDDGGSPVSGPGVKRFIGSVRRALSIGRTEGGLRAKSRERLSRPASAEPTHRPSISGSQRSGGSVTKRILIGGRAQVRVDFLTAKSGESFKNALREDFEQQASDQQASKRRQMTSPDPSHRLSHVPQEPIRRPELPRVTSDITGGSRSILIMNGTETHGSPVMEPPEDFVHAVSEPYEFEIPRALEIRNQVAPSPFDAQRQGSTSQASSQRDTSERVTRTSSPASKIPVRAGQSKSPPPPRNFSSKIPVRSSEIPRLKSKDSQQLRKYASVRSGKARLPKQEDIELDRVLSQASGSTADPFSLDREPARNLRRVPGGDLRGAETVQDLDEGDLSSEFSNTTPSKSVALPVPSRKSSVNAIMRAFDVPEAGEDPSPLNLLDTHSSQPSMRPSFELEVARLAQLPDDPRSADIQSALEKLEGRYHGVEAPRSSATSPSPGLTESPDEPFVMKPLQPKRRNQDQTAFNHRHDGIVDNVPANKAHYAAGGYAQSKASKASTARDPSTDGRQSLFAQTQSLFAPESIMTDDSYNSVPLLERGVSHHAQFRRPEEGARRINIVRQDPGPPPQHPPFHAITTDMPMKLQGAYPQGLALTDPTQSFYFGDNQSLSSLSSNEDPRDSDSRSIGTNMRSFYDEENGSILEQVEALPSTGRPTPTPTMRSTITTPPPLPPPPKELSESHFTSISAVGTDSKQFNQTAKVPGKSRSAQELRAGIEPTSPSSLAAHLPFILSYDSLLIAQQLTLIEKDALQEIDWRELIDLKWQQSAPPVRNWVVYLRSLDAASEPDHRSGVDLCIARFNLVVKWCVSEIILTQDIHERAACISKFIRIAHHCRRLRSWATMYQLTTALVSGDISRLKTTWSFVLDDDRETLKYLEALILPTRNFHNLRAEMETSTAKGNPNDAQGGLNGACVPFIGVYTHDLNYNAQKPEFANPPLGYSGDEKFINFERHHTAASIVKGLLALIESSTRYTFPPVPEVVSRCLWMSALDDDEIQTRSEELEMRDAGQS